MKHITVQALGDACPIPVVKTKDVLQQLQEDAVVEVHVDNEAAVQNVTRLASGRGFPVQSQKVADAHFLLTIQAGPAAQPSEAPAAETYCQPDRRDNTVVVFETNMMGRGSEELGASLMKAFIYALSQTDILPQTLLFYNGGAKLTVEGSASLEDLRSLEAQGVEILTCGTCLNFYGLTDKLAVGNVTNMYTIAEKLTQAGKIIKP